MSTIAIHASPYIEWHAPFAAKMERGLKRIGINPIITADRRRVSDYSILLGTTLWRGIEDSGSGWLLVDRCSFGDSSSTVSLVWNGHGLRGDHRVPVNYNPDRFQKFGVFLEPMKDEGQYAVLCGQTEAYSPTWSLEKFYEFGKNNMLANAYRPHPSDTSGMIPFGLPVYRSMKNVNCAITLNSSVAVDFWIRGIRTYTLDPGGMSYYASVANREAWLRWLAWTQWTHQEIEDGEPIAHLFNTREETFQVHKASWVHVYPESAPPGKVPGAIGAGLPDGIQSP